MDARIAHPHNTRRSNTDTARSCVDAEAEPLRAQETSQTCRAVANSPHADRIDRQAAGYTTTEQKRPAGADNRLAARRRWCRAYHSSLGAAHAPHRLLRARWQRG